jgi:hypothetical protein
MPSARDPVEEQDMYEAFIHVHATLLIATAIVFTLAFVIIREIVHLMPLHLRGSKVMVTGGLTALVGLGLALLVAHVLTGREQAETGPAESPWEVSPEFPPIPLEGIPQTPAQGTVDSLNNHARFPVPSAYLRAYGGDDPAPALRVLGPQSSP